MEVRKEEGRRRGKERNREEKEDEHATRPHAVEQDNPTFPNPLQYPRPSVSTTQPQIFGPCGFKTLHHRHQSCSTCTDNTHPTQFRAQCKGLTVTRIWFIFLSCKCYIGFCTCTTMDKKASAKRPRGKKKKWTTNWRGMSAAAVSRASGWDRGETGATAFVGIVYPLCNAFWRSNRSHVTDKSVEIAKSPDFVNACTIHLYFHYEISMS